MGDFYNCNFIMLFLNMKEARKLTDGNLLILIAEDGKRGLKKGEGQGWTRHMKTMVARGVAVETAFVIVCSSKYFASKYKL